MDCIQAAGVIVYRVRNQNIEFLLVQHRHGHWEFPKGKLDLGETAQQAAVRELAEETGLTAQLHEGFDEIMRYTFFDQWTQQQVQKQVHFFLGAVLNEQQVAISHEHADFVWLSYEQAHAYLTHKESKLLLDKGYTFLCHTQKST